MSPASIQLSLECPQDVVINFLSIWGIYPSCYEVVSSTGIGMLYDCSVGTQGSERNPVLAWVTTYIAVYSTEHE